VPSGVHPTGGAGGPGSRDPDTGEGLREGKYARIERERRFLLAEPPLVTAGTAARLITDRYVTGTRIRLRLTQQEDTRALHYKLTQKVPSEQHHGGIQGLITNIYLDRFEYELLAGLPCVVLSKTRYSVPPMGIDVFHGHLGGLVMAEAEFTSDTACDCFVPPSYCLVEVTDDLRFTGGHLARTDREELRGWLVELGVASAT
jgi:CYTH domain-containing protein